MVKKILKHLTITNFFKKDDLSKLELLENKLNRAKKKLLIAQREESKASQELNNAIEESLKKIENNEKELINIRKDQVNEPSILSTLSFADAKAKFEQDISELELSKIKLQVKLRNTDMTGQKNGLSLNTD